LIIVRDVKLQEIVEAGKTLGGVLGSYSRCFNRRLT
jgi:hypothetical protein